MAKDMRHYAKFTLDFPDNPKILPLSADAFRCLVEATIWSRLHQTDGFLPRAVAVAKWSLETLHELCTNDDDFPTFFESPNGWIIHDYAEHQDTKAEIQARLQQARSAGSKGGQASAQARAQAKAKRTLKQPLKRNPTREREREIYKGEGYVSNAREPNPNTCGADAPPPCPKHPDGYNHDQPCRRCQALRIHAENKTQQKETADRQRDEQIRQCGLCDTRGYIGLRGGPFVICPHNPQRIDEMENEYQYETRRQATQ